MEKLETRLTESWNSDKFTSEPENINIVSNLIRGLQRNMMGSDVTWQLLELMLIEACKQDLAKHGNLASSIPKNQFLQLTKSVRKRKIRNVQVWSQLCKLFLIHMNERTINLG